MLNTFHHHKPIYFEVMVIIAVFCLQNECRSTSRSFREHVSAVEDQDITF